MLKGLELPATTAERLSLVEEHIRSRLVARVRALQLLVRDDGLILRGYAQTYYAKQLAQ